MLKIKKTINQEDISSPENKELISHLHGDQVVQVLSQDAQGQPNVKVVMSQDLFIELMNSKSAMALPKEVMDKLKLFENLAKKVAKVAEVFQEDLKKKP